MQEPAPPSVSELVALRASDARRTAPHAHAQGQLFWVRRGALILDADTGRWAQLPGKLGWLPPLVAHGAQSLGALDASALYLQADLCRRLPPTPAVFTASPLAALMLQRLETLSGPEAAAQRGRLVPALIDVVLDAAPHAAHHLPLPTDPRLQRFALQVLATPDDRRTLDEWADLLGLSRRTLMRRFQQQTGHAVGRWRQQARLFAALDLLAQGHSVTSVALSVGYSSASAFIEQFRAAFGITPARLMT